MPSRQNIEAGKAFVTLYVKNDQFLRELNAIKRHLNGLKNIRLDELKGSMKSAATSMTSLSAASNGLSMAGVSKATRETKQLSGALSVVPTKLNATVGGLTKTAASLFGIARMNAMIVKPALAAAYGLSGAWWTAGKVSMGSMNLMAAGLDRVRRLARPLPGLIGRGMASAVQGGSSLLAGGSRRLAPDGSTIARWAGQMIRTGLGTNSQAFDAAREFARRHMLTRLASFFRSMADDKNLGTEIRHGFTRTLGRVFGTIGRGMSAGVRGVGRGADAVFGGVGRMGFEATGAASGKLNELNTQLRQLSYFAGVANRARLPQLLGLGMGGGGGFALQVARGGPMAAAARLPGAVTRAGIAAGAAAPGVAHRGTFGLPGMLQGAGMGLAGAGVGIALAAAPYMALKAHFAKTGKDLVKRSESTGSSVEDMSALKYAAGQSGVDFGDLASGMKTMHKAKPEALAMAGLSPAGLKGKSGIEKLAMLADGLSKIKDEGKKADAVMALLGEKGAELGPLLGSGGKAVRELTAEAEKLGFVVSDKLARSGAFFADMWTKIKSQGLATLDQMVMLIGNALSPVLQATTAHVKSWLNGLQAVAVVTSKWMSANTGLVSTLATIATVVGTVGVTLIATGGTLGMVGTALAGLAGPVAFLVTPLGLLTSGVIAAGVAFFRFTDIGRNAVRTVVSAIKPYVAIVSQVMEGIKDSLTGGKLEMAATIAFTGMKLAAAKGLAGLADLVGGRFGDFIGKIGTQVLGGDFVGAWATGVKALSAIWDVFTGGVVKTFTAAIRGVMDLWESSITAIGAWVAGKGDPVKSKLALANTQNAIRRQKMQQATEAEMSGDSALAERLLQEADRLREMSKKNSDSAANLADSAKNGPVFDMAAAINDIDKGGGTLRDALNKIDAIATAKRESKPMSESESLTASYGAEFGGASELKKIEAKLTEELDAITAAAKAERMKREASEVKLPGGGEVPDFKKDHHHEPRIEATTFSAAALTFLGGGSSGPQQILRNQLVVANEQLKVQRDAIKQYEAQEKELRKIREAAERAERPGKLRA